jgi:hypothetical protein
MTSISRPKKMDCAREREIAFQEIMQLVEKNILGTE